MIAVEQISQFFVLSVVLVCFICGYIIKNYTKIPNKHIPLIMMILGAITNVCISRAGIGNGFVHSVISGAISGLASTGSYELIMKSFGFDDKKDKKDD